MIERAFAKLITVDTSTPFEYKGSGVAGSTCFVETIPPAPDRMCSVQTGIPMPQMTKAAFDLRAIQLRIRGEKRDNNPADAEALYALLNCLDATVLDPGGPDEVRLITCTASQSGPVSLGRDSNERYEWSVNLSVRAVNRTAHRP